METTASAAMRADHLLLTRPEAQARCFAAACRARFGPGLIIIVAPLIEIVPRPGPVDTGGHAGLIFTSANGVRAFAARSAARSLPAWCVGARTAEAARDSGLQAISAGGDRRDLAALIAAAAPSGPLLHLRGAETAGHLVQELAALGISAQERVIYDQPERPLAPEGHALLAGSAPVLVPLFSPRAARIAAPYLRAAAAPLAIAAMSPAVAAVLPVQSGARIATARRPDAAAMLDAIEKLRG